MGNSILELVIQWLREGGFTADFAYPGQKFSPIAGPVAAVHLDRVDRGAQEVRVEVFVSCPAAMGGARCEVEALRATDLLQQQGAACVQSGCRYDSGARVFSVPVLATFTAATGTEEFGPGFSVYEDGGLLPFVTAFSAREERIAEPAYVIGENPPVGIRRGRGTWSLELEEQIPAGSPAAEAADLDFELKFVTGGKTEVFSGCEWTSVSRCYTREGLRRTRVGYALTRREV